MTVDYCRDCQELRELNKYGRCASCNNAFLRQWRLAHSTERFFNGGY